ncbi:TonB-dependent receptor [Winogradskyella sp. PC-19]|uniref:TonB-dependent receptor n=1 Tax=unclassified Winogradskyella TaxID=2615021 RepID=UPI000B3CAF43|nr:MULTISPECIES: TonB-dependent receptor [unclassified Winogradskyella]ARV09589.1 TonB-dependent receptor [Winogradskyella sp. PC-19]RZN83444.1 MAG: TonB-dependent receptor [Winogradskyella sp.]
MRIKLFFIIFGFSFSFAQNVVVKGKVVSKTEAIPYAEIIFNNAIAYATYSDEKGNFKINIPYGMYKVKVKSLGLKVKEKTISITTENSNNLEIELVEDLFGLEQVVVSATRNRVNKKEAPIIVNTLGEKLINATQALAVSESLNYSPGVRVENNCQNCGFTQVRLNGLDGSYSQILVNSRAVFSALNSVYGLEQIPTQIIDRVEIVRSGGSALFGSNAIAGTVNIITKDPILNTWEIGSYLGLVDGHTPDRVLNFNASLVADDLKSGATFFGIYRNRNDWDANGDGFTEMVELKNTTFGTKLFIKPTDLSRITLDATVLNEYRRGGDRLDLAPHLTDITEELTHNTIMGGVSYDFSNEKNTNNYSIYTSVQYTDRDSYYGGLGGERTAQDSLAALNAYGITKDLAVANGFQFTKNFKRDILTTGIEYNISNTEDVIAGYNRLIDQKVNSTGVYAQYEWKPNSKFSALIGSRLDYVNVDGFYRIEDVERNVDISQTALNPRFTLAYEFTDDLKFRGGYARGFRAPQAFNEDLHISSVGGEPQFVILSNDLKPEFSNAFTASLNFTKDFNTTQTNILFEGFYTSLVDPFTLVSTGATFDNGSILEEVRNGEGAKVYGTNFEFGVSPSKKWLFQIGGTLQKSEYDEDQVLFEADGTNPNETDVLVSEFVRNPNVYGYLNTNWTPSEKFSLSVTGTFTGEMTVPLVISDSGFLQLNKTSSFFDLNFNAETHFDFSNDFQITLNAGIKNMFNSFQDDFDVGAARDSDYVYGPALPRTFFVGVKIGKMH